MADASKIEWCDSTFNPWTGCTKVGPGCDHCYAEALMDTRYRKVKWGAGQPRVRTSPSNWRKPIQWNAQVFAGCPACGWRGERRDCPHESRCPSCGGYVRIVPRRVFCASLADVFDNEVDPTWRYDLFELIRGTPNLDWLLLTKRIGNVPKMLDDVFDGPLKLWPNIWLGATVVNQEEADRDIPKLLAIPARVRFLSVEPMLGPIDLRNLNDPDGRPMRWSCLHGRDADVRGLFDRGVDWIIAGGESGHQARPMHPDWVRGIRDQCEKAGVPFLFKQWGEWAPAADGELRMFATGDTAPRAMFPVTLRATHLTRAGKKAAGRLLDGRTWDGFPA